MQMRGTGRLLEWRARRFSDPVERLQFLKSKLSGGAAPGFLANRSLKHVRMSFIALGLALATTTLLQPFAKRALGLAPPEIRSVARTAAPRMVANTSQQPATAPPVWLVETKQHFDLYSNGLRVENEFLTSNVPRKYLAFSSERPDSAAGEWRTNPAGIVFHTTESHMAPFEEDQNQSLKRDGEGLLQYVSRRKSYHFVIDRFGRVFRVVAESDSANHAGNSVWADQHFVYLNLNESFFGVAFEARSRQDADGEPVNAAQVHAAWILTEMLRARYGIASSNCVAHAQVSVNPANRRAGYHTDWAANLPFTALGLTDNYSHPLPSVTLFGFEPDAGLADAGGAPLAAGIQASEDKIRDDAAAHGLPAERYRAALQKRYKDSIQALRAPFRRTIK